MSTRNIILDVVELTAAVTVIAVTARAVLGPDVFRRVVMRSALAGENICQGNAELWAGMASRCERVYHGYRNVTV